MNPSEPPLSHRPNINLQWIRRGLIIQAVGYAAIAMYGVLVGRAVWAERGPEVLTVIVTLIALGISQTRPATAAWLGMGTGCLQLTLGIYESGSLLNPSLIVYPILVAITGLLLGRRGALLMGALTLLIIPLAGFLGGLTLPQLLANNGQMGLWFLICAGCIMAAILLTRTALLSYGQLLARSEAERARYRELFEQAPDGLLSLAPDGSIIEANEAAGRLLGQERALLVGQHMPTLLGQGDAQPFNLTRARQSGRLVELTFSRGPADPVDLEISLQPAPQHDGSTLLVLRDITQRKLIEERMGHAQRLEAVGQLAGGIAHDFNNLLTAIGGSAELIMHSPDPEARELAQIVRQAQQRGSSLTQQLLAYARRDTHQPAAVELAGAVKAMTPLAQRMLGERCPLLVARSEPVTIMADAAQIEQVLLNLLSNARDSMPDKGQVRLTIRPLARAEAAALGSRLEHAQQAMIELADTGCGIPPELQRKIFEPFFTTKPKGKGTGLGLSAVQGIVIQNQGCITLESEVGAGTRFRIFFPALSPSSQVAATPAPTDTERTASPANRGRGRVLLVDDDPLVRQSAAQLLSRDGYEVVSAVDGEAALVLLADRGPFRLMLTDLAMPGMTGRELAAAVRSSHPTLPVVFMSGYFHESGLGQAENFLPKPFTREQLLRVVQEALAGEPA